LLVLVSSPVRAAGNEAEHQLAGLFMQSCLAFAGDAAGLRDWAKRTGLPAVAEPGRTAFLHAVPGVVFDASNKVGKFVVVSPDEGSCATLTDTADGSVLIGALEADLAQAGMQFRLVSERGDPQEKTLRYREYGATRNGRGWRILVGAVKDQQGGQAMLTAHSD
jgi:hypothetical protein